MTLLSKEDLSALVHASAQAYLKPNTSFSFEGQSLQADAINETLKQQMNEIIDGDYDTNHGKAFRLIEKALDEILPIKVLEHYGEFADTETVAQGDKAVYKVKISEASKRRAKGFVTRVGLAGRYEVFKLDGYSQEIRTSAIGGAAQIGFEEFLDGKITMADVYDLTLEGMDEFIYKEIAKALESMYNSVPVLNRTTDNGFVQSKFDTLLSIADSYAKSSIYCTFEFAQKIIPDATWNSASDAMKAEYWNNGYFGTYKGHRVIVLPQSFEEETADHKLKVVDPSLVYIVPNGATKPVKVVFEGAAHVREVPSQEDWSHEIQTYKKVGVALFNTNPGVCVYKDSSLSKEITTIA